MITDFSAHPISVENHKVFSGYVCIMMNPTGWKGNHTNRWRRWNSSKVNAPPTGELGGQDFVLRRGGTITGWVRSLSGEVLETVSREGLWHAFTPQMFRLGPLRSALVAARRAGLSVTDEASAVELAGGRPLLVEGSAAMAYAAARSHASALDGTTAVILCGGNVGTDRLRRILG